MKTVVVAMLLAGAWLYGQPAVEITGAVTLPLRLDAEALAKMPRAAADVEIEGRQVHYEGVWLRDILKQAGAPALKGKTMASYVLAEASDGYRVVFSLGELDADLGNHDVLLADHADGKPLSATQGPFRLVAVKEKRAARSVRMLTRIDVVVLSQ